MNAVESNDDVQHKDRRHHERPGEPPLPRCVDEPAHQFARHRKMGGPIDAISAGRRLNHPQVVSPAWVVCHHVGIRLSTAVDTGFLPACFRQNRRFDEGQFDARPHCGAARLGRTKANLG
jgi:hypothetical protein